MELGLGLRSFIMEETIDKSRIKNPERFSTSPCWIGLGRIEDADVEKQQELELLPSSMVKNQQDRSPQSKLRFRYQENIRKDQGFRQGGLIDVNSMPAAFGEMEEETMVASNVASPSSAVTSSLWMDLSGHLMSGSGGGDGDGDVSMMRKKLRLSKDQSAYLEAIFKNNNTLNPKLKLDLAKKLNLQTRQVEVWFQNRRARTKLKQTEVECEYLRRWCERLTEDNRRLQKELKALKASQPFLPMHFSTSTAATTLIICSSCATTTTAIDSSPSTVSTTAEDGDCTTTADKRC